MNRIVFQRLLLVFSLVLFVQTCFAQAPNRKILIEKITSAGCPGCPWGDYLIDSFLQLDTNIIPVAIHRSDFWHPDLMASPDGDSILSEYLWAHPTLMVDRYKWPNYGHVSMTTSFWSTMIAEREQIPLFISIGGNTSYNPSTRELQANLDIESQWELPYDVRTNVYVVESPVSDTGLGYDQLNGYNNLSNSPLYQLGDPIVGYVHHWVLRDMLGGHHGLQNLPQPLPAQQQFSTNFSTTLDSNWNENNIYVIMIVQKHHPDPEMREILNCVKVPLNASIAMQNMDSQEVPRLEIWPQPAFENIQLAFPNNGKWAVNIFDLLGKQISESHFSGNNGQISTSNIDAGLYLLKANSESGISISRKIIIR